MEHTKKTAQDRARERYPMRLPFSEVVGAYADAISELADPLEAENEQLRAELERVKRQRDRLLAASKNVAFHYVTSPDNLGSAMAMLDAMSDLREAITNATNNA